MVAPTPSARAGRWYSRVEALAAAGARTEGTGATLAFAFVARVLVALASATLAEVRRATALTDLEIPCMTGETCGEVKANRGRGRKTWSTKFRGVGTGFWLNLSTVASPNS